MARFLNRIRQSVDGLLAPADLPAPPPVSPISHLEAQLRQIRGARQRLDGVAQTVDGRVEAMQSRADLLRETAVGHVANGRSDLARLVLTQRQTTLTAADTLARQHAELTEHARRIAAAEQHLVAQLETLTNRRELITAQQRAALVQIEIGETLTGLNAAGGRPSLDLDIAAMEALQDRANAMRRLIDEDLLDPYLPELPSFDTDLDPAIDAELEAIERLYQQSHQHRSQQ